MADTKALFTERFDAARTALAAGDAHAAAASLYSAIVVARTDPGLRRELVTALFQLGKLSRRFGRAGEAEAESLLTEALAISEALFGREHAALVPLLNELSRLHIHRSQYARAQDVLERLLAIARAQSEESADVATALAGLALVKRKLGDDASAEALFKDALRIREKVLEPSHMVTVVTLEHLSETCAARGNFAEALALLRRGLETREVALGPGHATVQAARSRLAELELQAAVAADTAAAAPSTAAPPPVDSKKPEFFGARGPRVLRPAARSAERAKTPTVTAAVAAASLMASSLQTPSPSQIVISPPESARPFGSVPGGELGAAHRDAVLANVAYGDVASSDAALGDWQSTTAPVQDESPAPARKRRTALYLSAGVAAAAIAIAGLLMSRPRAGGGRDPVSTKLSAAPRTTAGGARVVKAPGTTTLPTAAGAAAMAGAVRADSLRLSRAASAPAAPAVQPEQRAPDSAPPNLRLPRVDLHLSRIRVPSMPVPSIPMAPAIDSIAHSAPERPRVSDTDRTGTGDGASLPTPADVENAVTPPRIVGPVPEPRFPDALLRSGRRDGQVVVRFLVNERGSVEVGSMIVERSDHELFTAAVRDILPRFQFEPARTHAPESKPVAAWVSVPFRFTTKR